MAKQMIEVDIPEGYEFVRYGLPKLGEFFLGLEDNVPTFADSDSECYMYNRVILKKKKPERIIFEKSFEKRHAKKWDLYMDEDGEPCQWWFTHDSKGEYYILTKVEE